MTDNPSGRMIEGPTLLEAALAYLRAGHIPIPMAGKRPLVKWAQYRDGHQITEDDCRQWWDVPDPPGIALILRPQDAVLDLDSPELRDAIGPKLRQLTRCATTTRGLHAWVETETPCPTLHLAPAVDLRGAGNLVIVPPTTGRQWIGQDVILTVPDAGEWARRLLAEQGIETRPEGEDWRTVIEGQPLEPGDRNWKLHRLGSLLLRYGADYSLLFAAMQGVNVKLSREPLPADEVAIIAEKLVKRYRPKYPNVLGGKPEQADAWIDAADIEPRDVEFLWGVRLIKGAINLLVGDPASAKSILLTDLAARVTRGAEWPDGTGRAPLGDVLILAREDDPASVIVPRLTRHGADLRRVHILQSSDFELSNLSPLEAALERWPETRLMIADPLHSYFDLSIDPKDSVQVRKALHSLDDVIRPAGVTALCVIHLNKAMDRGVLARILDSAAFRGVPRSILVAVADPSADLNYYLAHKKSNQGALDATVHYRVEGPPAKGVVVWEGTCGVDVDNLLAQIPTGGGSSLADAKAFLQEVLADGPRPQSEIKSLAQERKISGSTLWRAREEVGVKSRRVGDHWEWGLPRSSTSLGTGDDDVLGK